MTAHSRRSFIKAAAGAAAFAALPASVRAAAPLADKAAVGVHRMKLGQFQVTTLLDGYVDIDPSLLHGIDRKMIASLLRLSHLPDGPVRTAVNAFLVNTGDKLVLIDTGARNVFGPTLGRLPEALAAADVSPLAVDTILITHMHGDHIGGLLDAEGKVFYPNATLRISRADIAFWTSDEARAKAPKDSQGGFDLARKVVDAYGKRVEPLDPGTEIVPGIHAIAAYGHTPGHMTYLIESGGARLRAVGDILHVAPVQFPDVKVTLAYDSDANKARAVREAIFAQAAKEGFPIAAAHLPFPGIGYIRQAGKSYVYDPIPWQLAV